MKLPLRFAVIGCGFMGSIHARNIARSEAAELVFCCDVNLKRATQLQEELGAGLVTDDPAVVLTDKAIDVVVIATPHHNHAELATAAAQRGKHILLEKPMATTVADCLAVERAVAAAGVRMILGFKFRFAQAVCQAKMLVPKPILLVCQCLHDGDGSNSSWLLDRSQSGGSLFDTLVHTVDLIRFLSGSDPVRVYAEGCNTKLDRHAGADNAVATVRLANGATASIVEGKSATSGLLSKWCIQVVGPSKNVTIHDHFLRVREHRVGVEPDPEEFIYPLSNPHEVGTAALLAELLEAIHSERPASPGPRDGALSVLVCRQLERSIASGQPEPVVLPPVGS